MSSEQRSHSNHFRGTSPRLVVTLFALCLLSGAAGLAYEVLWLKQLSLLFGSTSSAAAVTLAAFFLGLALGSWALGGVAERSTRPLLGYAVLEVGIALSAGLYLVLLHWYGAIYASIYQACGGPGPTLVLAKFGLAFMVLVPPSFCMGGTLPFLGQYLIRSRESLGRVGSLLYATNTVGGIAGALLAGFLLPSALGFRNAYVLCIGVSLSIAAVSALIGRGAVLPAQVVEKARKPEKASMPRGWVLSLAFVSGVLTLGLEVMWTRMFAQVLQNSVFTFSAVLATFLLSLAMGSVLASILMRRTTRPESMLTVLLALAGIAVVVSVAIFWDTTNGLQYVGAALGWSEYLVLVAAMALSTMGPPGVLAGAIFPFLLKLEGQRMRSAGRSIGQLTALNTVGAAAGSLLAGFVLLGTVGMWQGIQWIAFAYFACGLLVAWKGGLRFAAMAPLAGILLAVTAFDPTDHPVVSVGHSERLLETWESRDGIVAVTETPGSRWIKVNNWYTVGGAAVGGTGSSGGKPWQSQMWQAQLPLLIHGKAESVFFLGMGTGIPAGVALEFPVGRVVVAELIEDVVVASRKYFEEETGGLHTDGRATVISEDGRNLLRGTRETFDLIVSDFFTPWHAGAGSLYSVDHYAAARERLRAGGMYAQWIPLYQMSEGEVMMVIKSMREVFPEVTIWRGNFHAEYPVLMLLGGETALAVGGLAPADFEQAERSMMELLGGASQGRVTEVDAEMIRMFYAGRVQTLAPALADVELNTDARPLFEYLAPKTQRAQMSQTANWFVGSELAAFFDLLASEPADDPMVRMGYYLHRSILDRSVGEDDAAEEWFRQFKAEFGP